MFKKYTDKFGLIVQKDHDGGDCAQREGTIAVLYALMGHTYYRKYFEENSLPKLKVSKGRYRRHCDPAEWYSRPSNFSRDQHSILNLAFAILGMKKELFESLVEIAKRFGFHQNFVKGTGDPEEKWKIPDIINPHQISAAIRGLDLFFLYPVLFILDIGFFLDLIFRRGNNDYDNMLAQNMFYASVKYPTIWVYLSLGIYRKTNFLECIMLYHCSENGIAPLYSLYSQCYDYLKGEKWKKSYLCSFCFWLVDVATSLLQKIAPK